MIELFNLIFNIGGWFAICITAALILGIVGVIIRHICFFLYGLFTWQKRVPIYVWRGNSFLMDWLSFNSPDHYEWKKMKSFKEWWHDIKTKKIK